MIPKITTTETYIRFRIISSESAGVLLFSLMNSANTS